MYKKYTKEEEEEERSRDLDEEEEEYEEEEMPGEENGIEAQRAKPTPTRQLKQNKK